MNYKLLVNKADHLRVIDADFQNHHLMGIYLLVGVCLPLLNVAFLL